jgi:ribonuclease HII
MNFPNFNEEKRLWRQGYEFIVGIDEVGRGPLAGPVVAASFIVRQNGAAILKKIKIHDSKKLSLPQREYFYNVLTRQEHAVWGIGIVSEKVIDKINILEGTKLAMTKAIDHLNSKLQIPNPSQIPNVKFQHQKADFLLIDGNFAINSQIPQKAIIRGDQKIFSIAAASIIAKVTRDRMMQKIHKKYPDYGFNLHKGYGTALHLASLEKFGPCKIHRRTFYPVTTFTQQS